VAVGLILDQTEKVPGKKKSGDLPPAIAEKLIDFHRACSGIEDVLGGVRLVKDGAMPFDIDCAHNCGEALLFLGGQWGTR
jgi:hypothetical protein